MAVTPQQVTTALPARYTIERELGRGGMATVYLAHDKTYNRQVAIKILRPELAATIGVDRFLAEIQVTAQLHHPHILPLLDSGDAGGVLYYVMPYVEGESLREKLKRDGTLPLDEALAITHQVANALEHAHKRGVVHRDVKPENILFQEGDVLLADFGISRAVSDAGGERLTETGLAIGTPAYMSPEQGMGIQDVDARTDVYALGCVLHEMLSGHAPFEGKTPQAILAQHAADTAPDLHKSADNIPLFVSRAVEKAMAKDPDARFQTVGALVAVLKAHTVVAPIRRRWGKWMVAAGAAAIVASGAVWWSSDRTTADAWRDLPLDPNTVAVLPFRVTATDPRLARLDDDIPNLFNAVLTGEFGPRAANPTVVLSKWLAVRDTAEDLVEARHRIAALVAAGKIMEGSLVQTGNRVTLTAWLVDAATGMELVREYASAPVDSVFALPTLVAMELFAEELGERADRLPNLVQYPQEAVAAYLAGRRELRAGRAQEALAQFDRAVAFDSTFALAALGAAEVSAYWLGTFDPGGDSQERYRRAEALRDNLSPRDQSALAFWVTFDAGTAVTDRDRLDLLEEWARVAPDDPAALGTYGSWVLGVGNRVGIPDWRGEARALLERAWALDSVQAALWYWDGVQVGDTAMARRAWPLMAARMDTTTAEFKAWRWWHAKMVGDTVTEELARAAIISAVSEGQTPNVLGYSVQSGFPLELAEQVDAPDPMVMYLPTVGRVKDVGRRFLEGADRLWLDPDLPKPNFRQMWRWERVVELWLASPGLDSAVTVAIDSLRRWATIGTDSIAPGQPRGAWQILLASLVPCEVALYDAARGDTVGLRTSVRTLLPTMQDAGWMGICPALVEALVESQDTLRTDAPMLEHVEALLRRGTNQEFPANIAMLLVARLHRQRGDFDRALAAARARSQICCWAFTTVWLWAYLKEEGELAALVGDTAGAIRAFEHYLTLRIHPDSGAVMDERDRVREQLAALVGERRRE